MLEILISFWTVFLQAGEVKSGSHGLQQQPVLQGQQIPLQVEYKTAWVMGEGWDCIKGGLGPRTFCAPECFNALQM